MKITEEKYAANLLGHDEKDLSTQISYKGVEIDHISKAWDDVIVVPELEPLGYKVAGEDLNNDHLEHYDEIIEKRRSKPMTRIHAWIKDYLNNPKKHGKELPAALSRGALRKACNANPKAVDEYLSIVEVEL